MKRTRPAVALLLDTLTSEYSAQLQCAVERAARHRGVDLLVAAGNGLGSEIGLERAQNRVFDLLGPDSIDGVIVVSATLGHRCGPEGLLELCRSYRPLPVCSIGVSLQGVPSLLIDNQGGMELAVGHLLDVHECRKIAFISGPKGSFEAEQRLAGYRKAHADRGLAVDDQLIEYGNFTLTAGILGMRSLLDRVGLPDAVAAANDKTALGALDTMQQAGISVPGTVRICGFDDINSAHFARPSLSTLRQPMWWLGEQSVDSILRQMAGDPVPATQAGPVEFVRRDSCGCGFQAAWTVAPNGPERCTVREVIRERWGELVQALLGAVSIPPHRLGRWPELLLYALDQELSGESGRFGAALEELLERAQAEGASLDEFQRVVSALRFELRKTRILDERENRKIERIWHAARVAVGAASIRLLGRRGLDIEAASAGLGRSGERLAATLNLTLLKDALIEDLPALRIQRAALSLYTGPRSSQLKTLAVIIDGREAAAPSEPFAEGKLAPDVIFRSEAAQTSIVLPITFDAEHLGVAVFGAGALPSVYESLRQQIGSAVEGALLHREMVAQVGARERLERERVTQEAALAADIQKSICPATLQVPGLEVAAVMLPAAEAGGDYYDVLPAEGGAWLAIGDVAGHGLGAGLVMLMIQSMVGSQSRTRPEPTPAQMVNVINETVWDNVRFRLRRDDHATLTVFRYSTDGRLRFAGAHEDILVWRSRSETCELVPTPGFWVGAVPDVRHLTVESELRLEPGDVMLLCTDGVTEPRNPHHEQFGISRVADLVRATSHESVATIRDRIVEAINGWSSSLDDDLTLLVARYVG